MSPSISVVIPTFNCGRFVGETIDSVLRQTKPPEEIVVIDDGSTDDTAAVVTTFGRRVRYIRQHNMGVSFARNHGFDVSRGDWIMFLDADDRILPNALEVLGHEAGRLKRGVVYGNKQTMAEDGTGLIDVQNRDCTGPVPSAAKASFEGAAFEPGAAIISRELIREIAGFDQRYSPCEDRHFWIRCGALAEFRRVPEIVLQYRLRAGSHSSNRARHVAASVRTRVDILAWLNERAIELFDVAPQPVVILRSDLESVYWSREWAAVDALLDLAEEYRLDCTVISDIRRRRRQFPAWVLRLKDSVDRLRR